MIECTFPREIGASGSIFEFVHAFFESHGLPRDRTFDVDLILEELFTNMVRHSTDGRHDIPIGLDLGGSVLMIVLRDQDVEPFNVAVAPAIDVARPARDRSPGGLGLHLVHKIADGISHQHAKRVNHYPMRA
jgi:serine/threonine-protein kinase RsbW